MSSESNEATFSYSSSTNAYDLHNSCPDAVTSLSDESDCLCGTRITIDIRGITGPPASLVYQATNQAIQVQTSVFHSV